MSWKQDVVTAINAEGGVFTLRDLCGYFGDGEPSKGQIVGCLTILIRGNFIKVVKRGMYQKCVSFIPDWENACEKIFEMTNAQREAQERREEEEKALELPDLRYVGHEGAQRRIREDNAQKFGRGIHRIRKKVFKARDVHAKMCQAGIRNWCFSLYAVDLLGVHKHGFTKVDGFDYTKLHEQENLVGANLTQLRDDGYKKFKELGKPFSPGPATRKTRKNISAAGKASYATGKRKKASKPTRFPPKDSVPVPKQEVRKKDDRPLDANLAKRISDVEKDMAEIKQMMTEMKAFLWEMSRK